MQMRAAWRAGIRRVRAGLIALALVCVCLLWPVAPALAESDGMIRVKLTRLGAPGAVTMTVDCDYCLAADPAVRIASGETVTVTAANGGMMLEAAGRTVSLGETAKLMRAQSGNRGIRFLQPELSNRFCGDLGLSASGGVITAILNIYVENYLYGVVGYAMPPSSGIEALKAQAVAARTYALRRKATRGDAAYDLTDAASDQAFKGYSGTSDYANVVKAVDDTRGGVLFFGSSLAQCYCCASNGGQTESAKNAFGAALDYSVVKDDSYDFESPAAVVKSATVNKDLSGLDSDLISALAKGMMTALPDAGIDPGASDLRVERLQSVTACDSRFPAPSRLYKSLTFMLTASGSGADGVHRTADVAVSIPTYGGFEDWYDLSINDEDNETVWVRETESAFEISFRRSGSGVGMSLRGAQTMAQQGKRAADILAFYYPGAEGRRLELADTTRDMREIEPAAEQKPIATARLTDRTDLLNAPGAAGVATATVAAGAVVDVYGVQDDWAAVGSGGRYGYVRIDALESFALADSTVVRPESAVLGRMTRSVEVLKLPVSGSGAAGTAIEGSEVQVIAWTDEWAMVRAAGSLKGFVPKSAVSFSAPTASDKAAEASDPETFTPAGGAPKARVRRDCELLEHPNPLANTLETLRQGDVLTVVAYNREWAQVKTAKGRPGYARLEDIEAVDTVGVDGGEIHKVKGKKYLYVTEDLASMYESWSGDSAVLMALCRGDKVRVGAYNAQWACVRCEGVTGYVRMEALSESKPEAAEGGAFSRPKAETTAVTVRDISVRHALNPEARAIVKLGKGQRVRLIARNAAWALVQTDDGTGFVPLQDLSVDSLTGNVTRRTCEARVVSDVKVYASAGDKGSAVGRLSRGEIVRVTAWNDSYACIDFQGGAGYVKLKGLERID